MELFKKYRWQMIKRFSSGEYSLSYSVSNGVVGDANEYLGDLVMVKNNETNELTCRNGNSFDVDVKSIYDHYRHEVNRATSFHGWPLCQLITPQELAAAGFYYTRQIDKVRCFSCNMEVCMWEENERALDEHKRWNARCMFLRDEIASGNVPILPRNSATRVDNVNFVRDGEDVPPNSTNSGEDDDESDVEIIHVYDGETELNIVFNAEEYSHENGIPQLISRSLETQTPTATTTTTTATTETTTSNYLCTHLDDLYYSIIGVINSKKYL